MKKHLFALLLSSQTYLCASYWSSAAPIPPGNSAGVQTIVSLAYNTSSPSLMSLWTDENNHYVYYSNFINGAWHTPSPNNVTPTNNHAYTSLGDDALVHYGSGPAPGIQMIAGWAQGLAVGSSSTPVYTFYDGSTWSPPQTIQQGAPNESCSDTVGLTTFVQNGVLSAMMAWPTTFFRHRYSIYDGNGATIALARFANSSLLDNTAGPALGIKLVTIPTNNPSFDSVIGAYKDFFASHPMYVIFDSVTSSWSAAAPITTLSTVKAHVSMVYDVANNRVIAAWISHSGIPTYSIYTVSTASWSSPDTIPLGGSPIPTLGQDVELAYDPIVHTIFAAWTNNALASSAYYSILSGTTWSDALPIPPGNSSGAFDDVSLAYNLVSEQMYGAWGNFAPPHLPYYTTFSYPITPPINVVQVVRENRFLSQSQICTQLFWDSTLAFAAKGYYVYQNGRLIATLPVTSNSFTIHNSNFSNTYQMSAFDNAGNESSRVTATRR